MGENNISASRMPDQEYKLDLHCVLSDVASNWFSILLLTLAIILITYVGLSALYTPTYTATATVTVANAAEDPNLNNIGQLDIHAILNQAGESAKFVQSMVSLDGIKSMAAKELGQTDLQGTISAKQLGESNILEVSVTAGSPEIALIEDDAVIRSLVGAGSDLLGGIEIKIAQEPRVLEVPANARNFAKLAIAAGILAFLMICTVLGWSSSAKYTVRNSLEAEPKLGVGLLGVIPREGKPGRHKEAAIITDPSASPGYTEEIRSLAIRLMNEMSEKGSKVLLFYGACEGEGTSTTAANVALALSQMNRKVVLLDMDFNNPSLAKILKMEGIQFTDFSQYLENGGTDDALCKVPGTELTVSLNSKAYPQSIYKHSDQIKTFLDNISKKADFVIVDTLPGSLASDAEELNLMADASVIVVRENYSEVTDITNAIAAQEDSNHLLGCVFNCARRTDINADAARYGNGGHYVG